MVEALSVAASQERATAKTVDELLVQARDAGVPWKPLVAAMGINPRTGGAWTPPAVRWRYDAAAGTPPAYLEARRTRAALHGPRPDPIHLEATDLTRKQAADILQVTPSTVAAWVGRGRLKTVQRGARTFVVGELAPGGEMTVTVLPGVPTRTPLGEGELTIAQAAELVGISRQAMAKRAKDRHVQVHTREDGVRFVLATDVHPGARKPRKPGL
jgi:predicted DNA-binding protein (UPF0251 family)